MKCLNIKRIGWLAVLGFTLLPLSFVATNAQSGNEGVYIIYDSSNSMWGALPDTSRKYEAARSAMRDLVGRDFGGRDVALRMYGHRRKNDCSDSQLVVPWSQPGDVAGDMVAAMEAARPTAARRSISACARLWTTLAAAKVRSFSSATASKAATPIPAPW